jgi:DinB family
MTFTTMPKMTEQFLAELEEEGALTRKALERVPEGRNDWKPHPKSMPLGYLAFLCANIFSWVVYTIDKDELDLQPPGGPTSKPTAASSTAELLQMLDDNIAKARTALRNTTDAHLLTNWRLLVAGRVVMEQTRLHVLRNSVFNHLAHHRGQLTVYLRLNEVTVPAIYGPSADERPF